MLRYINLQRAPFADIPVDPHGVLSKIKNIRTMMAMHLAKRQSLTGAALERLA